MKKILILTLLVFAISSQAQSVDAVVDKYVSAIGGAAKWKALKNQKMTITLTQSGIDIPGYIINESSNKERLELEFQGMKMVQAYDGDVAWTINQFQGISQPTKLEGAQAEDVADNEFLNSFIDYKKRGFTITYEGEGEIEGTACDLLKLVTPKGKESTHYFDKETGYQLAEKEMANGQESMSLYQNHTEVDGFLIPMKIIQKIGGVEAFRITVNKVESNIEVDQSIFSFPGN